MIEPLIIEELSKPPVSTFLVAAIAIGANLISSLARKFLVDIKQVRRMNTEIAAWRKELMEVKRSGDKAKLEKMNRKSKQMQQLQSKMMWQTFKPSLFFMLPFMGLWFLMSDVIGVNSTVAVSPVPIPLIIFTIAPELNLWWWYLISSFAFSALLTKAFRVEMS